MMLWKDVSAALLTDDSWQEALGVDSHYLTIKKLVGLLL